jgi:hypothetical protein
MTTLRTKDGRQLCYAQWGDPAGAPIFNLHGTPGCRLNRYPDDVLVPAAHGAWLATNVPSAKVVVNDDEGHSVPPERMLELLKSMIGSH